MKKIIILGSTGSIGTQSLDVIKNNEKDYKCVAISANTSVDMLINQLEEFDITNVCVGSEESAKEILSKCKKKINLYIGIEGMCKMVREVQADTVITSVVGIAGLLPTMEAINSGKNIALANKETLVTGGELVMKAAKDRGVQIIPVDSEHSAVFQSLNGENRKCIDKIILTASGGPFRGKTFDFLENVTLEQALKHPNWAMGKKITIDSATMMNKGLEVIEAKWLFDVEAKDIDVLVHPQSIVHSMVQYIDGSVIAQLGISDMRIPIQYALTYPERKTNNLKKLDLAEINTLTFEKIDRNAFKCFDLAMQALNKSGSFPCVLNAANEVAVDLFLKGKIGFNDIYRIINKQLESHTEVKFNNVESIVELDQEIRKKILEKY